MVGGLSGRGGHRVVNASETWEGRDVDEAVRVTGGTTAAR